MSTAVAGLEDIPTYTPDNLDKRILVQFNYFPNLQSVPEKVPQAKMAQAKSKARIAGATVMMAGTVLMCVITILFAKSQMRQNSLVEENCRRHMKYVTEGDAAQSSRLGLLTHTKTSSHEE